ncbi:ATP-binding protein [Psychrobacter sp. WY6]|uniref:ATP-binding protein n=1 Tax=Psychrobacter sp. WY6 TaxID=2708350 RepID=UPI002022DB9E|nr:ATP-binding protein [Psychrobacter sp. WY6]
MSTGNIVTGDNYFPRPADEKKLWRHLSDGAHVLLLAPRRVGKSSLITHIKDQPKSGYAVIYVLCKLVIMSRAFIKKCYVKSIVPTILKNPKR